MEVLRVELRYDPETGYFFRLRTTSGNAVAGSRADHLCKANGYMRVNVQNVRYLAHRVAYAMHHGEPPDVRLEVDHINGIRSDNRPLNLRQVNRNMNQQNRREAGSVFDDGGSNIRTSSFLGVDWRLDRNKWRATIFADGVRVHLGHFDPGGGGWRRLPGGEGSPTRGVPRSR